MNELQSLRRIMNSHAIVRRLSIEELATANSGIGSRADAMSRLNRVTARYRRSIRALHTHMWRNGMTEVVPAGACQVYDVPPQGRPVICASRHEAIQELRARGLTRDRARLAYKSANAGGYVVCGTRRGSVMISPLRTTPSASQSHGR